MSEPLSLSARRGLEPAGLGWRYVTGEQHVVLHFGYLHGGADPSAEVTATAELPGLTRAPLVARVKLTGINSKRDLARALAERTAEGTDWPRIVEAACTAVLRAMRQGAPVETVSEPAAPAAVRWLVARLLMQDRVNALFGPGGKGKGWLACAVGLCVQTGTPLAGLDTQQGNVLYYDYEDDRETFSQRLAMIARGWGRPFPQGLLYRHGDQPLHTQIEWLAGFCSERQIRLVIVDSFTFAAGVGDARGTYEDSAVRLLTALRLLQGVTVLLIDHVTGEGSQRDGLVGKQYGSIMKQNLIRNNLELKQDQEPGRSAWDIGIFQGKHNHGAGQAPLGFRLDFGRTPEAVCITRADVGASPVLSLSLELPDRLTRALRAGEGTVEDLIERMGRDDKHSTVAKALKAGVDRGRFVQLRSTPKSVWGLAAQP